MSPAKEQALEHLSPRWSLEGSRPLAAPDLDESFGRRAPRLLDIGVGNGKATRAWAVEHPEADVVAVELHRPGIARLLGDLESAGPSNVRVTEADVTGLVGPHTTFRAVRILFPDPWPKRRHTKRRLVDEGFVSLLADAVEPGGWLHLATDWTDYADQMRAAIAGDSRWRPQVDGHQPDDRDGPDDDMPLVARWISDRPPRPETIYELRAIGAGRSITDLVAHRA